MKHLLKIGGTMDKIRYGKLSCWMQPVGVLLSLLAVVSPQQPGFLSISCGGNTSHTAENNIIWIGDVDYINAGKAVDIGDASYYGSYFHTLRLFPKPLNKSCYQLPLTPNTTYLLRLSFAIGNYGGFQNLPRFSFSVETIDILVNKTVTLENTDAIYKEMILASSGTVLNVCLIRTSDSESDDPFISAIELRTLRNGMYDGQAKPGTLLESIWRVNIDGDSTVRYPQDNYDRLWTSNLVVNVKYADLLQNVSSKEPISTNNTNDLPPIAVMQTACVLYDGIEFRLSSLQGRKALLVLYFAEIQPVDMSEPRSFYVDINGVGPSEIITLVPNYSAVELTFQINASNSFNLWKTRNSSLSPIINAYEYYGLVDTEQATYSQDFDALDAIKNWFDIKDWISDPCYFIPWTGIGCDHTSSARRISEINLSGRNLTGSVPPDLANLTALVNVSLDNNHLMGSLPDFSHLAMLERLYLQNNNLSGTVPQWLSKLKNLKELNIENNNFSGVIPPQLHKGSLKLSSCGNPYLLIGKGECFLQNSNKEKNNLKLVLGITLSGVLLIALVVTVGIVVHRKRLGRSKEERVTTRSGGVEMEPRRFVYQDYSMIMVPNPTKSRAFTLDEMVAATQTFSREIGRGGFGSVFFGKLSDGKDIAVKVLSLFSRQGAQEFLNEVDLLSKINHRNLVSLLGYCNETREVMLVYEHMPGGSLRDHLYGTGAEHSELNWERRLKIALDAAQGLEYLHVGCTPKIIHRDIKSANILLDSNMNGKLADFGLSRMTIDGEATHVTTAVKGTAGYLDPEYYNTQMLTEKSDVYSFGVVLLEIICGRPPIDLKLPVHELNIVRWVRPYVMEMDENSGKIREIIDKRLSGSYNMKSMIRVITVAMRCVELEQSRRPTVSEVVAELKEAINHQDEDIASVSMSQEIGIANDDSSAAPVSSSLEWSEPKAMEWSDNSSNISKVGR